MKQTIMSLVIVFASLLIVSNLQAEEGCTDASFEGNFGFTGTGTILIGLTPGPIAFVGRVTADGKGNFHSAATQSVNGQISHATFEYTGTVNPDCTGSYAGVDSLGRPFQGDFVIANDGNEVRFIRTSPGQVVTFFAKKQQVKDCSEASLEGRFGYTASGLIIEGADRWPVAAVGHFIVDGKGKGIGADTLVINGAVIRRTTEGTYTVNPDCTGATDLMDSRGIRVQTEFVIVGDGEEFRALRSNPEGQVVTFTLRK